MACRNNIISLLVLMFFSGHVWAQASYRLNDDALNLAISDYKVFTGDTGLSISRLPSLSNSAWQASSSSNSGIPLNKGGNWLSFELTNDFSDSRTAYLVLRNKLLLADVQLYVKSANGESTPVSINLLSNNIRVGKIALAGHTNVSVFIHLKTDKNIRVQMRLMSPDIFAEENTSSQYNTGLASGGLLFLALLSLFVFFSSGNKSVLLICGYFATWALLLSFLLGAHLDFAFSGLADFRGVELPILVLASAILLIWFSIELFQLKQHQAKLYKILRATCWALLVLMPISIQLSTISNIYLSFVIHTLTSLLLLGAGLMLVQRQQRMASLFSAIVSIQLLMGMSNFFGNNWPGLGVFPDNTLLYSATFWLNGLLITFLISRQYFHQVQDKQAAQLQALESANASKKMQEELLAMQQEAREQLEVHVQERTLELNIALQELESANRELAEKNTQDDLTGLFNRRFYDQKIMAEYRRSKRNLTPLSLVVIDIDHFKQVNDNYGHLAGDHCIAWLGKLIRQCLRRSSDMGFRYGGEEFCLLLPETDSQGAFALAEELRLSISNSPVIYQNQTLKLTASCGISTYQQQKNITPEHLFAAADQALYEAKRNGRNQVKQQALTDNLIIQEQD